MKEQITQARVKELFDYRKDGALVWRVARGSRAAGAIAGYRHKDGYSRLMVDGDQYKAHRLIWLWHHGYLPESDLDHRNRNPGDNYIENLRETGDVCNQRNTGNRRNNSSGVKGVYLERLNGKWRPQVVVYGRTFRLGCHDDLLEAACHRLAAEQSLGWSGCDDYSPAFQYVKQHIPHIR